MFWQKGWGAGLVLSALLLLVHVGNSLGWKPIASGSSPITSYSLKQSHPGEASSSHELATSYAQFGEPKEEDDLLLTRAALINGVESSHPITLIDDHDNHYKSYGLKDDAIEKPTISFPRSNLYASDRCSVKKFAFNQDGAVEYDNELPELDQFTLCFWMRFTNHSGDHVMLTYEGECVANPSSTATID